MINTTSANETTPAAKATQVTKYESHNTNQTYNCTKGRKEETVWKQNNNGTTMIKPKNDNL